MYTALQFKKTIFEPLHGQALPLHQLCCDLIYLILLFAKCSKKEKKKSQILCTTVQGKCLLIPYSQLKQPRKSKKYNGKHLRC